MKKNIVFAAPIVFIALCLILVVFSARSAVAYADASPYLMSVTAVTGYDIDENGIAAYTRGEVDPASNLYRKDYEVVFNVGTGDYRVELSVGSGDRIDVTDATVRSGQEATYRVKASGIVTVYASTYIAGEKTGETSVVLKSDNESPVAEVTEEMTDWIQAGLDYTVKVDLNGFSDELSGRGKGYYKLGDGDFVAIDDLDLEALTFVINDNTTLVLLFFDAAGNMTARETSFDRFDGNPPPVPKITVTPNVSGGRYARFYTVEINYYPDLKSGLAEQQVYFVNDEEKVYTGSFQLDEVRSYTIRAYSEDAVGNRSTATTQSVLATDFDADQPSIASFTYEIALRNQKICTAYVTASDQASGVARVYFSGLNAVLSPVTASAYRAEFDCYGVEELVLVVEDYVGNKAIEHLSLNLFGDSVYSGKIFSYADKYASTDFSLYNEKAKQRIDRAYDELDVILSTHTASKADFDAVAARIDAAYEPTEATYSVISPSAYLSGMLEYEVDPTMIEGYKVGDEVKLMFKAAYADDTLVSAAGYRSGFSDGFSLALYLEGKPVSGTFAKSVKVALNLPVGYYDREFSLYRDGLAVQCECMNNKLEFEMTRNADYVLVVSGSRTPVGSAGSGEKYISAFGRKLSYGAFFGTIFGTLGGVLLLVGGILLFVFLSGRGKGRGKK